MDILFYLGKMWPLIWLSLLMYIFPCWCQLVTVTQQDKLKVAESGTTVEFHCQHTDSSSLSMFWYQQKGGQGLKLMVYSTGAGSDHQMETEFSSWTLSRPEVLSSTLTLHQASPQDSAVYFCAVSKGDSYGDRQYFGEGTILSVLGKDEKQLEPKVKIFPPNKNELKDHNLISLVCVASGFFPEHVRIYWYKNEAETLPMYQSVPQKDGSTYYTSARLSLTRSEYFNPSNSFKCAAAFVGSKNMTKSEVIAGELDCAVPKEKFGMYINEGKVYYILVFFKSFAYALIVLILIWRKKVIAGSY